MGLRRKNVASRLEAAGYVDLYALSLGAEDFMELDPDPTATEEEEERQQLPSEAKRLAAAARAVCGALGVAPHVEEAVVHANAVGVSQQLQCQLRDRGDCPEFPAVSSRVGVVPGVGCQM